MTPYETAFLAFERALDGKALDPVLLDVRGKATYAEYLLIVSGRSERQLSAIAEHVLHGLAEHNIRPLGSEGMGTHWILIDFGDVVMHAMLPPIRDFYDLEGLWCDAPRVELEVPPESRLSVADAY